MSTNDELKNKTANGTKPVLGEVYVFEACVSESHFAKPVLYVRFAVRGL